MRSDTMILVRLDPSKGATAVMSLPRDLKVRIPGHGTDKINAAYALGGPRLAVRTVRELMASVADSGSFPINHVVNVNFGGFRRAVNRLGCVYADVDRRYFNDNNPPNGGGPNYATIDIDAGYQRMCGQDALDYVRYRHFDSDLVRAARQQEFLRQAKEQVGVAKIFSDRKELLRIFARYTQTDIRGTQAILRLLKLAAESAQNPVQEVRFPGRDRRPSTSRSSQERLRAAVARFMDAKASPGRRGEERRSSPSRSRPAARAAAPGGPACRPGWSSTGNADEDVAVRLATRGAMPVVLPQGPALDGVAAARRHARLHDLGPVRRGATEAYRMVFRTNEVGQYYGVQGTTWKGAADPRQPVGAAAHRRSHSTSCSSTATACGSWHGGPRRPSTGSRTPSCRRCRTARCSPWRSR